MAGITDFLGGSTGSLIGAGLGLLAGGSSGGNEASSTKTLDPRIAKYIYGADGSSGLLGDAQSIYSQQMQNGGLNDMQRQGLDMKSQYLQSPQYTNSYQAMMNQGMGLMNSPVAGNPFTRSQQGAQAAQSSAPVGGGYQYQPSAVQAPVYRPVQQPAQAAQPAAPANLGISGERSGGNRDGGGGSTLGTGRMTDAINDSSLDAFKKYLGLGLTPAAAAAAVQQVMATNQTLDAVNASEDPIGMLNAIQGWTDTETAPAYEGRSGNSNPGRTFGGFGNSSFGEGNY